jgi:hypothetical protein
VIVTTKTERFARALLAGADARLSRMTVIGREPGQPVPKPDILRRLAEGGGLAADGMGLWFVEDMLETLQSTAARPDLTGVRLFLAEWGYNTAADRAGVSGRITRLPLSRFAAGFEATAGVRTRAAEQLHDVADTLQSVADTVDQGLSGTPPSHVG